MIIILTNTTAFQLGLFWVPSFIFTSHMCLNLDIPVSYQKFMTEILYNYSQNLFIFLYFQFSSINIIETRA